MGGRSIQPFHRQHGITAMEWKALIARAETGTMAGGARKLGISLQTFKNHISNAIRRLGAANMWEAYRTLGWLVLPFEDGTPATGTPHPGIAHEFQVRCFRCGEGGYVHVSLVTDTERVQVVPI
jgi:hypothetical protein